MEIEELQGSSKGSTALHGSPLGLSDAVQLSEVRQPVMKACLLPAFPPFHLTRHLQNTSIFFSFFSFF